jgi:hypothetical protein
MASQPLLQEIRREVMPKVGGMVEALTISQSYSEAFASRRRAENRDGGSEGSPARVSAAGFC